MSTFIADDGDNIRRRLHEIEVDKNRARGIVPPKPVQPVASTQPANPWAGDDDAWMDAFFGLDI